MATEKRPKTAKKRWKALTSTKQELMCLAQGHNSVTNIINHPHLYKTSVYVLFKTAIYSTDLIFFFTRIKRKFPWVNTKYNSSHE